MYTVDQLAAASGVSRRSIYNYVERKIVSAPIRRGRRQVYTEDHLIVLHAIRLLGRMGVPMWQIERLVTTRDASAVRDLVRPVEPVAAQLDEAEDRVAQLRDKVTVSPDQLDLADLGLDDPIWLRRELVRAENHVRQLTARLQEVGDSVLQRIAGGDAAPDRSASTETDRQDQRLARLERLVDDLVTAIDANRSGELRGAFRAGLVAARQAGWSPKSGTAPPPYLPQDEADVFREYVRSSVEADRSKRRGE